MSLITGLDHLVLTVADIDATRRFYAAALGVETDEFAPGRFALAIGGQKINLHQAGREFEPKAERPTPGSGDLCLITAAPLADVIARLAGAGVAIVEGPVPRAGARGPMTSVYFRDPDGNLVEVAQYA